MATEPLATRFLSFSFLLINYCRIISVDPGKICQTLLRSSMTDDSSTIIEILAVNFFSRDLYIKIIILRRIFEKKFGNELFLFVKTKIQSCLHLFTRCLKPVSFFSVLDLIFLWSQGRKEFSARRIFVGMSSVTESRGRYVPFCGHVTLPPKPQFNCGRFNIL